MNTKVELLCILCGLFVELSFGVANANICLTWNTTGDNVFFKCNVLTMENEIHLIDAVDNNRARCFKYRTPHCVTSDESDMIFEDFSANGFSLVLKTRKKNVDGEWKCIQGSQEDSINVILSKGTVHSADLFLYGEIMEMKEITNFKLTCFSCWIPALKSVYLFVNDILEDIIRYSDGKCYHKRKMCSPAECSCSTEGNNFTWSFKSDLTYVKFSCEMRFSDNEASKLSFQRSNLIYNITGFVYDIEREKKTITYSDKDIYLHSDNPGANDSESGSVADTVRFIVLWIITICCILLCLYTRKDSIRQYLQCRFKKEDQEDSIRQSLCHSHENENEEDSISQSMHSCHENENEEGTEFEGDIFCSMCCFSTACATCIDCKTFYCDACCVCHLQSVPEHKVYQIQYATSRQKDAVCSTCRKLAAKVCSKCFELFCLSCPHNQDCMVRIYQISSVFKIQKPGDVRHELNFVKKVPLPSYENPVRIYGIEYLDDGTLVALDGNNNALIVFIPNQESFKKVFEAEPCAMTKMTRNTIAITFPNIKRIMIYDINIKEKSLYESKEFESIAMEKLKPKYKPYSIAYNQGWFAIEIGERDDGNIIIFEYSKNTILNTRTIECTFAYFTGHTIRLALDRNESKIYISAIGRRVVNCLNFEGKVLWRRSNASPRSILILDDTIILSSRRCNAIYEFDKQNGRNAVLAGSINSPRFIAHRSSDNQFCIHVKNKTDEDELAFYQLQCLEDSSSKSTLQPK